MFGGSFDPLHLGHVYIAGQALAQLALQTLLVVPTSQNPLKSDAGAEVQHRQAFAAMLADMYEQASVSDVEIRQDGPGYSAETLGVLAGQYPDSQFTFLMGSDAWQSFARWKSPEQVLGYADIVIYSRPAYARPDMVANVLDDLEAQQLICYDQGHGDATWQVRILSSPGRICRVQQLAGEPPDISSTDIRRRVRAGQSVDQLVPEQVSVYIQKHRLYCE